MSKELEALNKIQHDFGQLKGQELVSCYETIFNALKRLEAIDNANPSEALNELNRIENNIIYLLRDCDINEEVSMNFNSIMEHNSCAIIKQALLKAQEPKQYLKWEDLESFEEQKDFFALLNGNKYTLWWYRDSRNKYVMINLNEINIVTLCDMFKQDIDFFNDLHLERVEE